MSSSHYIIVARHDATGKIELPLGDMTIYGCEPEGEEEMFKRIQGEYGEDWTLAWYEPMGGFYSGIKDTGKKVFDAWREKEE